LSLATEGAALPRAQSRRWQPLRSGLVNIYRYDVEEFRWSNGRLLLRGNNGAGKSRVMALQLPSPSTGISIRLDASRTATPPNASNGT
jgi:hypothetical protein